MTPTVSTSANISAKHISSTTAFMVPTKNLLCPLRLLLIIPPLKSNFPGLLPKFLFLFFRARTLPSRVRSARLCLASALGSLRSAPPCFRPGFAPLGSALLPSRIRSARLCLASALGSLRPAPPSLPLPSVRLPGACSRIFTHARSHTHVRRIIICTIILPPTFCYLPST